MSRIYTQEEYDAAILAHKNIGIDESLESIEGALASLKKTMNSSFRWTMALLIGLYPVIFVYMWLILK